MNRDRRLSELALLLDGVPATPEALVEYARGSVVKRASDGSVDFVSPIPCPYVYGCVPGVASGDADALDAVVLGGGLEVGARVRLPVRAVVDFVDAGELDPKLVLGAVALRRRDRLGLRAFFETYALFKRALARSRGARGTTAFRGLLDPTELGLGRSSDLDSGVI